MAELIACRVCLQPNCEGCNINTLANRLFRGKFDCLMDEHHTISSAADVYTEEEVRDAYTDGFSEGMAQGMEKAVVRCEDCKWIDEDGDCAHEEMLDQSGYPKSVKKDFFCGHGEKRAFDGDYVKYGKRRR